ncbi:MAG TPA: beta-ribofuranosylaminobenzene 5'-phosphate synthase family protein [Methylovirgula sp.]|nr:beta-ribofuranosylaminobenzene 5'-phosphate synthase family protein [Methylovirgula sp.]
MHVSFKVTASARLHLGFLDLNGGTGRRFGSLGLAIDRPVTSLTIERATATWVEGPERERVGAHLAALRARLGLKACYRVTIREVIPAHVGLGSGTQLALAIAAALRRLEDLPPDTPGDALFLERGLRSGIGAALFSTGGLVVDGGHGTGKAMPPILCHLGFPEDWRVILVMDAEMKGVHGTREGEAFATLPQFPAAAAADICRRVLMQALPALAERDLAQFGEAISRIQTILGNYFAPAQGGARYTSPSVAKVMARLEQHGAKGIGQSSWGPTGFGFVASDDEAQRLVRLIRKDMRAHENRAQATPIMLICKGINHGARIEKIVGAEDQRREGT